MRISYLVVVEHKGGTYATMIKISEAGLIICDGHSGHEQASDIVGHDR
jgi:hypothetical protein